MWNTRRPSRSAAPQGDGGRVEPGRQHALELSIECGQRRRQVGLDAPEDVADRLVEARLDEPDRTRPYALELLPPFLQGVAQPAQLVLDLLRRPRPVPDTVHLGLEVRAQRRDQLLRRIGARRLQHHVGGIEHLAEQVELGAEGCRT